MADNVERAQKYEGLLGNAGWHEFVDASKEEMERLAGFIELVDTRDPGWAAATSRMINRYQALKLNIESVEKIVEKERKKREKVDTGK